MARVSYVNGEYLHHHEAMVHIEDRGYQFADGIYEYYAFYNHTLLDAKLHMKRLERSLKELGIPMPMSAASLGLVMRELIGRNNRCDGGLYLQITRGVARRDHPFPKNTKPALSMTVCGAKSPKPQEIKNGVAVMSYPDHRWERRDIKSVALLANVLAKQEAAARGLREAWLLMPDGKFSEGSVSNAYIINAKGEIVTHPADHHILGGITRDVVLKLARANDIKVIEKPFSLHDVKAASEAFITSTSANVLPVVKLDDTSIGNGKPGPVTAKLMALYHSHIHTQTGKQF